jgi:hypothetical protein
MEKLVNCKIIMDVEIIDNISGANQYFEVMITAKDKTKYKIILNHVWDMRWSIENASIDRWYQFRKCLPEGLIHNSVYMVEDSEYIKYFEYQISGTYPTNELKHYILHDNVDSTLDILTLKEPILVKIKG